MEAARTERFLRTKSLMAGSGRSHPKKLSLRQDQYILLYDISPRRPCCWFLFLFRFLIPSTEQRPRTRRRTTTCSKMMSKSNCLNLYTMPVLWSLSFGFRLNWTQLTQKDPTWKKDTLLERRKLYFELSWPGDTLLKRKKLNLELNCS